MCNDLRFVTRAGELPQELLKLLMRTTLQIRVIGKAEVPDLKDGEIPILYAKKGLPAQFVRISREEFCRYGISPQPWHSAFAVCVAVRSLSQLKNSDRPLIYERDRIFKSDANKILSWFSETPNALAA